MKYRPTEHALVKPLDDGAVALNTATGDYFTLNETAARMWALIAGGASDNEIVTAIVSDYATSSGQVEEDLARLIGELRDNGLLAEK